MENNTLLPVFVDCMPTAGKYEPLWITAMVLISAISTTTAMILRVSADASPALCWEGGGGDGGNAINNDDDDD